MLGRADVALGPVGAGNGFADGGGFVGLDLVVLVFIFRFGDVLQIELVNGFGFEVESEVAVAEQDDDLGLAFVVGVDVPGDGDVAFDIELGGLILFPSDFPARGCGGAGSAEGGAVEDKGRYGEWRFGGHAVFTTRQFTMTHRDGQTWQKVAWEFVGPPEREANPPLAHVN